MAVMRYEVGIVTNRLDLAQFYERVFRLERLPPFEFPIAVVDRLGLGGQSWIKIMRPAVPAEFAASSGRFWDRGGIRYLTLWVDDLEGILERGVPEGGAVISPPTELRPGVRSAIMHDPDGNAIELMQADL